MPIDWTTPPPGIPREIWTAVQDLCNHRIEFDTAEANENLRATDPDEGKFTWCVLAAELIGEHLEAHRKMAAYNGREA